MAQNKTKAFDFAQDSTKQVLTLSTAVVTITIAFLKDIAKDAPGDARVVLFVGWALFAIAILAGVCTLLNLTGRVAGAEDSQEGINDGAIRLFAVIQQVSFALAIAATIFFGVRAFDAQSDCAKDTTESSGTATTAAAPAAAEASGSDGC